MSWEKDATRSSEVVVIAKNGMGYGEGAISTADQLKTSELTEQALAVAMEIVQERSEVFCDVDADANDDGCGDGRPAAKVFRYLKRHGETIVEEYKNPVDVRSYLVADYQSRQVCGVSFKACPHQQKVCCKIGLQWLMI